MLTEDRERVGIAGDEKLEPDSHATAPKPRVSSRSWQVKHKIPFVGIHFDLVLGVV